MGRVPLWLRVVHLLALAGTCVAAFYSTFKYTYLANANTRFHGWPVPQVIFQRDGPGEPWLDFVGPTVLLAYPMNVVLFSTVPALLVLAVYFAGRRKSESTENTLPDASTHIAKPVADTGNPYQTPSQPPDGG